MSLDNLPVEWLCVNGSDCVFDPKSDIVDGPFGSNLKSSEYTTSGIPVLRIQNIKRYNFVDKNIQFVSDEKAEMLSRHSFQSGDIVITKLGNPIALACIVPPKFEKGIIVADLVRMRPASYISTKYMMYYLNSKYVIDQVNVLIKGTTRPRINLSVIRDLKVVLPSLAEQQEIVRQLDVMLAQVEQIKARLDAIPAILKKFRQSVLADAVSGKLTEEWRGTSDLSNWQNKTLGDISVVKTGKTPSRKESRYWKDASIPWLTSSATGNNFTDHADEFISEIASKECNLKPFPKGTLLLAMYGEGKTRGQVTELLIDATCNQACAAILVNNEIAHKSFVKIRLLENYENIRKAASGGNQPNLNLNKVREIDIALPPLEEQSEIVQIVKKLFVYADKIEETVQSAQKRVNLLTQSILAKAFSGELTAEWRQQHQELITGLNSAESLLAKIQAEQEASKSAKKTRKKKEV
ncbi:restriction endonuclease subunit S [Acinetobacter junii]|uniref:restriction endonuclease subunit S n=1 Tax=Acinetobacter junii TaxID=40215 RepID=UPI001D18F5DC|nr:restriction endonuclease subunit S [Acinetobacter junii]